jgi:isopropylmalate/homocitrate/citramalate synthase
MIKLVEVAPRDGLQNETAPAPTKAKIAFVDALSATGVDEIEYNGEKLGVNLQKLLQARRLLDPFLKDNRSALPEAGSPACAACRFSTEEVCC